MALRQHDLVLADGRFRVVLTDRRRLFAVLDAPETALGPLRVALEIERRPRLRASTEHEHVVAGVPGVRALALPYASEGIFNLAAHAAPTLAAPAFDTLRDAAVHGSRLLTERLTLVPEISRPHVAAAARLVLRARLGDLSAKRFIARITVAVRSGAPNARPVGDALVSGSRFVDHAIGSSVTAIDVFQRLAAALQRGDFPAAEALANEVRTKRVAAEAHLLDEYVALFGLDETALRLDANELIESTSPRFIQPLSRGLGTRIVTGGIGIGDAIGIATDAASGNVAGVIGDAGGAAGGSIAKGAAIGGAIGSVIPGIGTAIGGAVGAVIGGIGSLFGGHSGPIDFEHMMGGLGQKLARQVADKIRHAPRWQAHFQAVYRHLPAGTANAKGLGDMVARELFPHDEPGKDATTGHADGLAEWFAQQPDWEQLIHSNGVPPGDRHQLEARVHAAKRRLENARKAWDVLLHPAHAATKRVAPPPPAPRRPDLLPTWEPVAALPITTGCACDPKPGGEP